MSGDDNDNNLIDESSELGPDDILELEDEDGNTLQLALLAMIELEGKQYVMTAPLEEVQGEDDEDGSDINIILLAYTPDDEGGTYEDIEDPELYERVMQACMELVES